MDEMISFHSRISLFVASFSPMWFILIGSYLIDRYDVVSVLAAFLVTLVIIGCIIHSCSVFDRYRQSTNMDPVTPEYLRDVTHKYTMQLLAYAFFALIDVTSDHNVFVLISLAFFICIIFSRTNIVLTNPAFLVLGFRLYESKVSNPDREILLLSSYSPRKGAQMYIKQIAPGIYIDKLKY